MSFRTFHFDGVVRVPGYVEWLLDCDMRETYQFHREALVANCWQLEDLRMLLEERQEAAA